MATRRKKPSTRVRGAQAVTPRKKARPPKGGRQPVSRSKKPAKKPTLKKRKVASHVRKRDAQGHFLPSKGAKKPTLKKRQAKKKTPKKVKPVRLTPFEKQREKAITENRMVMPHFPKRMGRTPLRGTDKKSKQRDVMIGAYWEDIREGWLWLTAKRIYASLLSKFKEPPTLYARFTFSLDNIRLLMAMGSPKLLKKSKTGKLNWWFVPTSVSHTLEGAMNRFETTFDNITQEIQATRDQKNPKAIFFLEYVTFVAYILGPSDA